tara:strand:- start:4906 stop:5598 length:693 start_codon:yes stop_codon:yes gene_type:complete
MALKLIYFKMRSLAEAPQMLMHYAGIRYNYEMSWDFFKKDWENVKPTLPFKQLPLLVVDDAHQIPQSIAILGYLQQLAGLNHPNPLTAAKMHSILLGAHDLFLPLNPILNFAVGEDFSTKKASLLPALTKKIENLEHALDSTNSPFFVDSEPRACDFLAYHHLDLARTLYQNIFLKFPRITELLKAIESIDPVRNYLETRPKLIDIGVSPKLIINGTAHPTGTKNTENLI